MVALISRQKKTVILIISVFVILAGVLVFSRPLEYGAKARVLIVPDLTGTNLDPYAAAKTNERLGNLLASVINSGAFFDEVMNSGFDISPAYFTGEAPERLRQWQAKVTGKAVADSGIVEITVFHPDRFQAEEIAQAISQVIKTRHEQFHAPGEKLSVKTLDQAIVSRWPVRPNLWLIFSLSIVLGFIFAVLYLYLVNLPAADMTGSEAGGMPTRPPGPEPAIAAGEEETEKFTGADLTQGELPAGGGPASGNYMAPALFSEAEDEGLGWEEVVNQGDIRNILDEED